jgi:hypothetical protein
MDITENSNNKSFNHLVLMSLAAVSITVMLLFSSLLASRLVIAAKQQVVEAWDKTGGSTLWNQFTAATLHINANDANKQTFDNSRNIAIADDMQADVALPEQQTQVSLVIPPKQQISYRLEMARDYELNYAWNTDGKAVSAELRGKRTDAKDSEYKKFASINKDKASGLFICPFNGQFGWYWQNKTNQPVTVTLLIKGTYKVLER